MTDDDLYDEWQAAIHTLTTTARFATDRRKHLRDVMRMYCGDPSSVEQELYPLYCSWECAELLYNKAVAEERVSFNRLLLGRLKGIMKEDNNQN